MPLYEYYCPPCSTQFEVLRPMSKMADPAVCPRGHTTNNRVISLFATLQKSGVASMFSQSATAATCCGGAGGCSCHS